MKRLLSLDRRCSSCLPVPTLVMLALTSIALVGEARAQNAYITNSNDNTVSVIDTTSNLVIGDPIPVGVQPFGVAVSPDGKKVYITNQGSSSVTVIDAITKTVIGDPIPVGAFPSSAVVTPDGSKVYVGNSGTNSVSVIDTVDNTVSTTLTDGVPFGNITGIAVTPDGNKVYVAHKDITIVSVINTMDNAITWMSVNAAYGLAVTPDGSKLYVATENRHLYGVFVIDTASDTVIGGPILTGSYGPRGLAITPDGSKVYVTDFSPQGHVFAIDTTTDLLIGQPIFVGTQAYGIGVSPDSRKVFVANTGDNTVSVIDTTTNTVIGDPIPVGSSPAAFGLFIQPARQFAGAPGRPNCRRVSVDALVSQYGKLDDAAEALNYASVRAVRHAIRAFCAG